MPMKLHMILKKIFQLLLKYNLFLFIMFKIGQLKKKDLLIPVWFHYNDYIR